MTEDTRPKRSDRCEVCHGRGEFFLGVCSIPGHPPEKTKPCKACDGTGLNKAARAQIKREERAKEKANAT